MTALFYCTFPELSQPTSSLLSPEIYAIDTGKPILDFVFRPDTAEFWILVDAGWSEDGSPRRDATNFVEIANFSEGKVKLILTYFNRVSDCAS